MDSINSIQNSPSFIWKDRDILVEKNLVLNHKPLEGKSAPPCIKISKTIIPGADTQFRMQVTNVFSSQVELTAEMVPIIKNLLLFFDSPSLNG